jgi:hypothetical protein
MAHRGSAGSQPLRAALFLVRGTADAAGFIDGKGSVGGYVSGHFTLNQEIDDSHYETSYTVSRHSVYERREMVSMLNYAASLGELRWGVERIDCLISL